ncbi:MAG: hypothetical protein OEV76_10240, partial [Anaerolineae bacterium]|nr:hypothetical protein [Anaerolineae bacterium]
MALLAEILGNLGIGQQQALMLALLLPFFPLLLLINRRIRERGRPPLRPILGYQALQESLGRAAEGGRAVHVSMGTGGLGGASTAESLAGLTVLEHVASHGEATGAEIIATVSDPSLLPVAQDVMREACAAQGHPYGYEPSCVRFISPNRAAYAAGVMEILGHSNVGNNIMVGSFGDEVLLMGEVGALNEVEQVGGTSSPQILPLLYASSDHTLIGEEMFAAGAYLRQRTSHLASLATQDWVRTGVIVAIVIG